MESSDFPSVKGYRNTVKLKETTNEMHEAANGLRNGFESEELTTACAFLCQNRDKEISSVRLPSTIIAYNRPANLNRQYKPPEVCSYRKTHHFKGGVYHFRQSPMVGVRRNRHGLVVNLSNGSFFGSVYYKPRAQVWFWWFI